MAALEKDEILARLRKVASLARRGEGGEAGNAAALLADIAAKYGIDLADIDGEGVADHVFRTGADKWRQELFAQIVWCRAPKMKVFRARSGRGRQGRFDAVRLRCAHDLFVEAVATFEILSREYARQRKALFLAFLGANGLILDDSDDDPPRGPLTEAERQLVSDAARLAAGIEKTQLRRQLPGEGTEEGEEASNG